MQKGVLVKIRRGLYTINLPFKEPPDTFELAEIIYGPSYISMESALSYHGWIPEAVYTITSATTRRKKLFKTPLGVFAFFNFPVNNFIWK